MSDTEQHYPPLSPSLPAACYWMPASFGVFVSIDSACTPALISSSKSLYMIWCRCTSRLPSNSADTTSTLHNSHKTARQVHTSNQAQAVLAYLVVCIARNLPMDLVMVIEARAVLSAASTGARETLETPVADYWYKCVNVWFQSKAAASNLKWVSASAAPVGLPLCPACLWLSFTIFSATGDKAVSILRCMELWMGLTGSTDAAITRRQLLASISYRVRVSH